VLTDEEIQVLWKKEHQALYWKEVYGHVDEYLAWNRQQQDAHTRSELVKQGWKSPDEVAAELAKVKKEYEQTEHEWDALEAENERLKTEIIGTLEVLQEKEVELAKEAEEWETLLQHLVPLVNPLESLVIERIIRAVNAHVAELKKRAGV
jgi:septal ring factor EnvC (AmiA/AmiB activator)